MRKWLKLFLMLSREVTRDQSDRKKSLPAAMIGTAILKKDNFTGKKYWVTQDVGCDEVAFTAGQSLTFPPEGIQVGTRIHFLPPEE